MKRGRKMGNEPGLMDESTQNVLFGWLDTPILKPGRLELEKNRSFRIYADTVDLWYVALFENDECVKRAEGNVLSEVIAEVMADLVEQEKRRCRELEEARKHPSKPPQN